MNLWFSQQLATKLEWILVLRPHEIEYKQPIVYGHESLKELQTWINQLLVRPHKTDIYVHK